MLTLPIKSTNFFMYYDASPSVLGVVLSRTRMWLFFLKVTKESWEELPYEGIGVGTSNVFSQHIVSLYVSVSEVFTD